MNINDIHWNFSDNGTKEPAKSRFWNFYNFWTAWNFLMRFSLLCSGKWALSFYICVFINTGVSLKYEAYPIKWTSDTWCFAGLYLPCGSFQRLRWSTAVWCHWRNLKPVHVIRKILWKTESVMIGKIVTFWRVKMQIWVIYGILLVTECCGTLGTAVNEAYFALFSMGAHVTGMTPKCIISFFFLFGRYCFQQTHSYLNWLSHMTQHVVYL